MTWQSVAEVAEVAALRRDALGLYRLIASVPQLGRLSLPVASDRSEYLYWCRFFDHIEVTKRLSLDQGIVCKVTWYRNHTLHRDCGPAACKWIDHTKQWTQCYYRYGELHRVDGPAVIWETGHLWYLNNQLHRDGAPAVWKDGTRYQRPHSDNSDDLYFWYHHGTELNSLQIAAIQIWYWWLACSG